MCEYITAGLLSEACNLGWCLSPGRRVKFRGPGSRLLQLIHFLVRVQCLTDLGEVLWTAGVEPKASENR